MSFLFNFIVIYFDVDNRNPSKKARHRDEGRNGGQQYSGRKDK